MKKPVTYGLLITLCNIIAFVLLLNISSSAVISGSILIGLPGIILCTEFVLGIVFSAKETKKYLGAGLVMGVGLTLLIGLGVVGVIFVMCSV